MCLVTWLLNASEAGGGLAVIQTSQTAFLMQMHANQLAYEKFDLHNKSSELFISTRLPAASLPFKGQLTEQTAVEAFIDSVSFSPQSPDVRLYGSDDREV